MNSYGTDTNSFTFKKPKIGIIGGSGMCSFSELKIISTIRPETKYGLPSDEILIGEYCGQTVAFLPRHGKNHTLAPHKIPYKANISALKDIGVEYIIGTCIAGSLKKEITPGSIVLLEAGKISGIEIISQGTSVVIQWPRFSTKAESQWFSSNGWDIVNMTQYPECYFARELGICYASIAGITDYDVGLQTDFTFGENNKSAIGLTPVLGRAKRGIFAFPEMGVRPVSHGRFANILKTKTPAPSEERNEERSKNLQAKGYFHR